MTSEGYAASRAGGGGQANEDAFIVRDGLGLYVVLDGEGDAPFGEVAASIAADALEAFMASLPTKGFAALRKAFQSREIAAKAVRSAVDAVIAGAEDDVELDGMATTVSMLLIHKQHAYIAHVGDSRVYLLREGYLHQLTSDYDLALALGGHTADAYAEATIECFALDARSGDTFILCTDGAENAVEDPRVLQWVEQMTPSNLAHRLIEEAAKVASDRDATVIAVQVRRDDEPGWIWLSQKPVMLEFGHTVLAN